MSEPDEGTMIVTFSDGKKVTAIDWWWEERNFLIITDKGEAYRFKNTYINGLKYDFPDAVDSNSESVTLVGNNKIWEEQP